MTDSPKRGLSAEGGGNIVLHLRNADLEEITEKEATEMSNPLYWHAL